MNINSWYADKAKQIIAEQKKSWTLCRSGYEGLNKAEYKEFDFDNLKIKIQFNPRRIVSSSAKVDEASVKKRECFLCRENLPAEQEAVEYEEGFLILANPYPIFPEHFTVPSMIHTPQKIKENFRRMLELSRDLSEYYTVFYNGPKCGASAPDHLHFQAVTKGFMPVENEIDILKETSGRILVNNGEISITAIEDGLRRFILTETSDEDKAVKAFNILYNALNSCFPGDDEPMMNIISVYNESGWKMMVFPRIKHRPSFYFKEGTERVLLSPATTEMGGLFILPREEDYNKINKELIAEVYKEVVPNKKDFNSICGIFS